MLGTIRGTTRDAQRHTALRDEARVTRTKRTGSVISAGRCHHLDFFSVLDVEGVAQRLVEVRARSAVEVAYCARVE